MINITANGNSEEINWGGGLGYVSVAGTFDGATVKLQCNMHGAGWVDVGDESAFTTGGVAVFEVGTGLLRFNTASGGASLNVNASVETSKTFR